MNIIILLGAPGAGKGTVSEVLTTHGIEHVSTGDMLRKEIRNNTARELLDYGFNVIEK